MKMGRELKDLMGKRHEWFVVVSGWRGSGGGALLMSRWGSCEESFVKG